ncbi:hypothetical protein MPSEU_000321800 [Mayamaea pseudoterrestris]|nr:hypothetical protein MPSEU_000321800 [Mayamaea pseudoterrestris]
MTTIQLARKNANKSTKSCLHPQRLRLAIFTACFLATGFIGSNSNTIKSLRNSISAFHLPFVCKRSATIKKPPLYSLISKDEANITGKVDWLLDFVIADHPKCATTSIMQALYQHEQVKMYNHEIYSLANGDPVDLVKQLYALGGDNKNNDNAHSCSNNKIMRGYKSPNELRRLQSLWLLQKYFPTTKLIVGLRHPVWWFQSWYNFKATQGKLLNNHSTERFVDNLPPMLDFHKNLAQLGKTNATTDSREQGLLGNDFPRPLKPFQVRLYERLNMELVTDETSGATTVAMTKLDNPVFLYVDEQVNDPAFSSSLQSFLHLDTPIAPIGRNNSAAAHRMDVCHYSHRPLRAALVELGSDMADWILEYFVTLPEVTVSSPNKFRALLLEWKKDPCRGPLVFEYD